MFNQKEYMKKWYLDNREKILKKRKKYYEKNSDKEKKRNKRYYENNKEKIKKAVKQYCQDNPEGIKESIKKWNKNNPERVKKIKERWRKNNPKKVKENIKRWQENNPERLRKYNKQYVKHMRKTDLKFNLNSKIATAIRFSLKGNKNGRHWETLVGYNLNDLIKHLKKTMPEGHNWQEFMTGKLHIDHIIPISVFNFTKPEHTDFKRCWELKNLRLLPAKENLVKGSIINKPFQPALKILY